MLFPSKGSDVPAFCADTPPFPKGALPVEIPAAVDGFDAVVGHAVGLAEGLGASTVAMFFCGAVGRVLDCSVSIDFRKRSASPVLFMVVNALATSGMRSSEIPIMRAICAASRMSSTRTIALRAAGLPPGKGAKMSPRTPSATAAPAGTPAF